MTTNGHFADLLLPSLLRARGRKGISRRQLAEQLGKDYQTLGTWERASRTPSEEDARAWAEALGVPWPERTKGWFSRETSAWQPCGTRAAFLRHQYRGEEPDAECREAQNDYHRKRRAARRRAQML